MRQEQFIARHQGEWSAFEHWLDLRGDARSSRGRPNDTGIDDEDVPARYRRICDQLALARKRGYSPQLIARLQHLMQRGHVLLYRTPPPRWRRALQFVLAGFPRQVRQQATAMWISAALFVLPLVVVFATLQVKPEVIHSIMTPQEVAGIERMYDPSNEERLGRDSGTDWGMFGLYIMNNTSIGLRTFASGLLGCLGTVYVLIANGVGIGAVFGHLQQVGFSDTLWRFVVGHAPFELTAIVLTGGAGLRLGYNLMAPGRRSRVDALVEAGRIGARICLGAALMFFIAAFIEAFWSSIESVPAWGKFTVSGVLWTVVLSWLLLGGRGTTDEA
ncbi:MAG TPA: stage II sporulation protein M [Pseudoxanthomonas sp.]|nr:stage II sporulation protein M [Pseudoxanthomonas sp.]